MRLMFALAVPGLLLSACALAPPTQDLSLEAVCLQHFENDPVERDRCRLSPEQRSGTVPDIRPQDLPVRSGGPGD